MLDNGLINTKSKTFKLFVFMKRVNTEWSKMKSSYYQYHFRAEILYIKNKTFSSEYTMYVCKISMKTGNGMFLRPFLLQLTTLI